MNYLYLLSCNIVWLTYSDDAIVFSAIPFRLKDHRYYSTYDRKLGAEKYCKELLLLFKEEIEKFHVCLLGRTVLKLEERHKRNYNFHADIKSMFQRRQRHISTYLGLLE